MLHHIHHLKENNYGGTLCNDCNLKLPSPKNLPVVTHNLSYILSLILKDFDSSRYNVEVNKKNGNHYNCVKICNIQLLDSLNMLKGSLSNLTLEHIKNKRDLLIVRNTISHYSQEAQDLLLSSGKQFFPYEYL